MPNFDDELEKDLEQGQEMEAQEEERGEETRGPGNAYRFAPRSLAEKEWQRESKQEQADRRQGNYLNHDGSVPTDRQQRDELTAQDDTGYSANGRALAAMMQRNAPETVYLRLDDERDTEAGLYRVRNSAQVQRQVTTYFEPRRRDYFRDHSDYEVLMQMREGWHHRDDDGRYYGQGLHAQIDVQRLRHQGRMLQDINAQHAAEELSYRITERGLTLDEPVRMITPHADRSRDHMPPADIHPTHHLHDHRARPVPRGLEVLQQIADEVAERLPRRRPERDAEPTLDDRRQAFAERQWRAVEGAEHGGLVDINLGAMRDDNNDMIVLTDPRAAARIIRGNFVAEHHQDLAGTSTGELLALVAHDTEGLSGSRYADDLRRDGRVFADDERQRAAEELSYRLSQKEHFREAYSTLSYEQQRSRDEGLER